MRSHAREPQVVRHSVAPQLPSKATEVVPTTISALDEEPSGDDQNLYELLGVDNLATHNEIYNAYRRHVMRLRAAKLDASDYDVQHGAFKAAFEILTDEQKRARYDTKLFKDNLLDRQAPSMLQDLDLDESSLSTTSNQIRRQMRRQKLKAIDIFRQVDADASGRVSVSELTRALSELGLNVPLSSMQQIFRNFDADGSGQVDYEEFCETLRRDRTLLVDELSGSVRDALGLPPAPAPPADLLSEPGQLQGAVGSDVETRSALGKLKLAINLARTFGRAGAARCHPLAFKAVKVGVLSKEVEAFDAYEFVNDVHLNNRGASQLAVVTHPVQVGRDGDTKELCVAQRPLHHALAKAGWSVLAYEAYALGEDGSGEAEAARLRAVMAYVAAHRKLRYCRCALVTQGTGASAAFMALHSHPEAFDYRVRALSACQPAGVDELKEALLSEYAPACTLPVLLSDKQATRPNTPSSVLSGDGRPKTPAALKVQRMLPDATPSERIEVQNYPLYGKSRRFEGSRFFGDNPKQLLAFLDEHTKKPIRMQRSISLTSLRTSNSTSSLRTTISAARLTVAAQSGFRAAGSDE